MDEKVLDILKEKIQCYFKEDGSHGFDHTQRVYNLAVELAKEKKDIDLGVIKMAALLHDIARMREVEGEDICHAEEGSKMAEDLLKEANVPEEKISKVVDAIKVHRYSKGLEPESKEAEILQDADRLDALGAICIARVCGYGGMKGRPLYRADMPPKKVYIGEDSTTAINHFYEKIFKIKPETFKTKVAQTIARERYKFIEEFVERFIKEWEGKL